MNIKSMLSVTLSVAALTFSGLALSIDMTNADCVAKLDNAIVGGSSPATGYLIHRQWSTDVSKGEGLDIEFDVPVPNKLPGFGDLATAIHNNLVVTLARGRVIYAQCTVNASQVVTQRGHLRFAMVVRREGDQIKWHGGLCDVEPWVDGIQEGVPIMYDGDIAKAYVMQKGTMYMVTKGIVDAT